MQFLLDTNVVIALLKSDLRVWERVRHYKVRDIAISSVTLYELFYGSYSSERVEHNLQKLEKIPFEVLDFDIEDARCAGETRAVLEEAGKPIGPYDLMIAGQAKARKLTVITANVKEFRRVQGLRVENWETET